MFPVLQSVVNSVNMDVLNCQDAACDQSSFGSNVSRLKSRFLQSGEGGSRQAPSSSTVPSRQHATSLFSHGVYSSPEIQRRVASATASSTWSTRQPSVSVDRELERPEVVAVTNAMAASASSVLDIADHVERFKHTRALFAQLAEQNSGTVTTSHRVTSSSRSCGNVRSSPPPAPGILSVAGATERSMTSPGACSTTHEDRTAPVVALFRKSAATAGQCISSTASCTVTSLASMQLSSATKRLSGCESSSSGGNREASPVSHATNVVMTSRTEAENRQAVESVRRRPGDISDMTGAVVMRRNVRHSVDSSRAVLLPKRRSREEKTIASSKDEIEASLCHADEYWRRQRDTLGTDCQSPSGDPDLQIMSESTFSSGSGEEMARSDSGHDLTVINDGLSSPMISSTASVWPQRLSSTGVESHHTTNGDCSRLNNIEMKNVALNNGQGNANEQCVETSVVDCVKHNNMVERNGLDDIVTCPHSVTSTDCVNQTDTNASQHAATDSVSLQTANNGCCVSRDSSQMDGSLTDSEAMQGSLPDCDCKDVGTEKQITNLNSLKTLSDSTVDASDVITSVPSDLTSDTCQVECDASSRPVDCNESVIKKPTTVSSRDRDSVQDMSVSEDEDSGDADYVLLGQPIAKRPPVNSATVKYCQSQQPDGTDDVGLLPIMTSDQEACNSNARYLCSIWYCVYYGYN